MGVKKRITLKTAFWKFLIMLLVGLSLAVAIPFGTLLLSTTFDIISYADYSERSVQEIAPIIATTPDLTEIKLPAGCKYLILNKNYQVVETTLEGDNLERAMEYATTGVIDRRLNRQYLLVTRENELVILQYYIGSQFTDEWMNEHLPSPEILLYVLIGLNCVFVCAFLTTRFAKNLRSQLSPLYTATAEVAQQNLDFEVEHSKIREFEEVLLSFSSMKESLKTSLEQQWKADQIQKEQIAALAHDLKTPLTVIQGNADLISETNLDAEQQQCADYIISSSEKMQSYIRALIDISKATIGIQFHSETVDFPDYLKQLELQMIVLCKLSEIQLETKMKIIPQQLTVDKTLLERTIMNILNNALYYSPQEGTIYVYISTVGSFVQISIVDEGKGFSQEALLHAKEQFYMSDQSRHVEMHYGMGLYIADSIVEQHGGQLILENSLKTGGAKVTIQIPC
ncbi:MAG: HAMP domain-containing sensor histidine kinase [Lachnospiraceae bacterium]|nr:HAMP domain-containing sensor histidine kinase [Lachnospiraceae bacterium]MDD3417435.1 HAMP domain-containing sensor histidine kinase [Lachnospiraceae bacterium]